jgi:hypothetical protein
MWAAWPSGLNCRSDFGGLSSRAALALCAPEKSDFHGQYLSRANTRWTCNPRHFFLPLGVETAKAVSAFVMPYSDVTPDALPSIIGLLRNDVRPQVIEFASSPGAKIVTDSQISQNSLLISLLAGNFSAETGPIRTGSSASHSGLS